jgi:hypothetical protein
VEGEQYKSSLETEEIGTSWPTKLRAEERGAWYFDVSDKETLLSGEIEIEDWRNYHLAVETWYVNVKKARTEEADGVGRT